MIVKQCAFCGKEFEPKNGIQRFCSTACYMKARNEKRKADRLAAVETVVCPTCGKEFEREYKQRRFCSDECARLSRTKAAEEKRLNQPAKTKQCVFCGKPFASWGRKRYCSPECRKADREQQKPVRKQRACPICGKLFIGHSSKQVACSPECSSERERRRQRERSREAWKATAQEKERARAAALQKPPTNKPVKSIAQILREARERGLSYGQYMLIVEGRS